MGKLAELLRSNELTQSVHYYSGIGTSYSLLDIAIGGKISMNSLPYRAKTVDLCIGRHHGMGH